MANHVVIMAGGIGSRFWPISTPENPKQFIDILGCGKSLIQLTTNRFEDVCPKSNFWVVTNAKYIEIVKQQLPEIPLNHILAEPEARNTAPCIAWACWKIKAEDSAANIVVTPSDAYVLDTVEFRRVIKSALLFTEKRFSIVTIGVKPSRPETGYGYIHIAEQMSEDVYKVESFKEKPDFQTAKEYLTKGNYLWNAGIFVWNVQTIVDSITQYSSQIANFMNRMAQSFGNDNEYSVIDGLFPLCDKISIDYAVMEPASKDGIVFTCPADFGWSDLGNWASLYDQLSKDRNHNATVGPVDFYESTDCVVHIEGLKKAIIQGLEGYIISEKNGQLLICKRDQEQRIREFSIQ